MKSTKELSAIELDRQEMLKSYTKAILDGGGDPSHFLKDIDTMTVAEMMDGLAQNGVRFTSVVSNVNKESGSKSKKHKYEVGDIVKLDDGDVYRLISLPGTNPHPKWYEGVDVNDGLNGLFSEVEIVELVEGNDEDF